MLMFTLVHGAQASQDKATNTQIDSETHEKDMVQYVSSIGDHGSICL